MTNSSTPRQSLERELAKAMKANKAPAISRAVAVLRLLGRSNAPLGVLQIARELGLVPSTCLYVLKTLVAEELVSFEPETKRYSLEAGILTLARQWLRGSRFNELAQPMLDRLAQRFSLTTLGVQVVGLQHLIVVAASRTGNDFQLSVQIGSRFPALISATGRCIAAFADHSQEALESRFNALRWDKAPTLKEWREQVIQTRARGYAIDVGNYVSGVTIVAVPVFGSRGKLGHALVTMGISETFERSSLKPLPSALKSAAKSLADQL